MKKIIKLLFLILILFGFFSGLRIAISKNISKNSSSKKIDNMLSNIQLKRANVTSFFTYGDSLNISGILSNIDKQNFENAKIILTDGENEVTCNIDTELNDNNLVFSSSQINKGIELDRLDEGEYYIFLRVKLNNSANARYYSLENNSEYPNIEYYTVTRNNENKKVNIEFLSTEYKEKEYKYLSVKVAKAESTDGIYDIVLDAGHGGKDEGERLNGHTEADIALDYVKDLKIKLEDLGLKVKLTRDDDNSASFTTTNMYDDNGRITIACNSKAKYMFSFHINNGNSSLSGVEIYAPSKSDLSFAKLMAQKIVDSGANTFSNNTGFKKAEGVFVWTFTKQNIRDSASTATKKGYEPYNITTDTVYQYTIREVGGIATNAYADGRNTAYAPNRFYNSNQGIECYQIELGYIKNDLDKILYNKELYIDAIVQSVKEMLQITSN